MQSFITTVEGLKETVKVNKSESMFNSLLPYLDDAFDKYVYPYLGDPLTRRITKTGCSEEDLKVYLLVCRALGPLAVAMASPELGILIGDSGHTVTRTDKMTVASDHKIARAEESMIERGWMNIERLLDHLELNKETYPEWACCRYRRLQDSNPTFFDSAKQFQEIGCVQIGYSRLTFELFRPTLAGMMWSVRRLLGDDLYGRLLIEMNTTDVVKQELVRMIRYWMANTVAKLHTSQITRVQRSSPGILEYKPVIRPLYADPDANGNYYAEQAEQAELQIRDHLLKYAGELGLPAPEKNDFNSIDKHIFVL